MGNALSLASELDEKPVIRDNVVIPDYDYLSSMVLRSGIDATWDFRIGRGLGKSLRLPAITSPASFCLK